MLYVFTGEGGRAKLRNALTALEKRAPDANVERITDENVHAADVEGMLASQGLFYAKRIVIFDNALGLKEARERITPHLKDMAKSEHVFFVLENIVDAAFRKTFAAHATKVVFGEVEEKEKKGMDWSAANALARKDAHKLWLALAKSFLEGAAPEAVHGQLFWKAKQMFLIPRPHIWSQGELRGLIAELAELPHEARRRGMEVEYALERFALEL